MKEPFSNKGITNPSELFGRECLLQRLVETADRCENVNIIGCRRFGKTSLINCVYPLIKTNNSSKAYPIVLDFKTKNIKGNKDSFLYMIASLMKSLCLDGIFVEKEMFGTLTIKPSKDTNDIVEQLDKLSFPRIQALLEDVIRFFSALLEKHILFIFDEYEYLFKYCFEDSNAFMPLRALADERQENTEPPIFSYWLVGAISWDVLSVSIGSGVANNVTISEYVTPLTKDDFSKMWNYECSLIDNSTYRLKLIECEQFAFEKSGGVPFYGKVIGANILRNVHNKTDVSLELPLYTICEGQLKELYVMENVESSLDSIVKKSTSRIPTAILSREKEKGIVIEKNGKNEICIKYLYDYIKANMVLPISTEPIITPAKVARRIQLLIENINKTQKNKQQELIFTPVIDMMSTYDDLSTPCSTREQIQDFLCSMYKIYFEWTKDNSGTNKARFPHKRFKYNDLSKYIDILRHTIGGAHQEDHLDTYDGQISKADALLALTDSNNEPFYSQEFQKLQMELLSRFEIVLIEIQRFVNTGRY